MTVLTVLDEGYGWVCPKCGGFKWQQSAECRPCFEERLRDEGYWARRTCACGGAKASHSLTCKPCANRKLLGNRHGVRRQPQSHPWRRAA